MKSRTKLNMHNIFQNKSRFLNHKKKRRSKLKSAQAIVAPSAANSHHAPSKIAGCPSKASSVTATLQEQHHKPIAPPNPPISGHLGYRSRTWSRAPPHRPCTWRTPELVHRSHTSTRRGFALCFNFLSFDFFWELIRGREWMGGEEERAVSRYWKYLSEESGVGPTRRLKYLSDVNWKIVPNGWV